MSKIAKLVGAAGTLAVAMGSLPAHAEHSTIIACYAYVHVQCYGNGENNCDSETYNWGLDQCDQYYSDTQAVRPKAPSGLAAATTNRQTRANIANSFKR
jgi:hypothetical protein